MTKELLNRSKCHNSSVSPVRGGKEGDLQCDVCGHPCEIMEDEEVKNEDAVQDTASTENVEAPVNVAGETAEVTGENSTEEGAEASDTGEAKPVE